MSRNVTKEESEYKISDSKVVVKKSGNTYKSLKVFYVKIKNIDRVKEAVEVTLQASKVLKGTRRRPIL